MCPDIDKETYRVLGSHIRHHMGVGHNQPVLTDNKAGPLSAKPSKHVQPDQCLDAKHSHDGLRRNHAKCHIYGQDHPMTSCQYELIP